MPASRSGTTPAVVATGAMGAAAKRAPAPTAVLPEPAGHDVATAKAPEKVNMKTPAEQTPTGARPKNPIPKARMKRPLPLKSVQRAASAFKNFSLSRFAGTETPANYVPAGQAKMASAVTALQSKSMTTQTAALAANPPQTLGLTVALTAASLGQLLPSLDTNAGSVSLNELLGALKQNLRGTEFYASGNPTLNLVVQDSGLLSQVQAYISAVKAGTAGNVTAAAVNSGAAAKPRAAAKPGVAARVAANKNAAAVKKGGA